MNEHRGSSGSGPRAAPEVLADLADSTGRERALNCSTIVLSAEICTSCDLLILVNRGTEAVLDQP